jgi:hypothetical protein
MKPYLLLALLALGGCATDTAPAREAVVDQVAACRAHYAAGGMTAVQLWQCSDKATLAYQRASDPRDIDLYQAAATRNEQIAAMFDAGKISKAQADDLYASTDAEVQKTVKGRREAMETNRPSSCAKYSDVSSTGNANCY